MDHEGVKPNGSTFVAIAAAGTADLPLLRSIHARATASSARDLVLDNVMLDSFARLGALELARSIFDAMEEKTLVSWNAMIGAYARLGREDLVLFLFRAMDLDGVRHNRITFLNAIAGIQSIDRGKFVQERAAAAGFEGDIAVRNALVSLYGRCRSAAMARRVFDAMERRTRVTWTAMISAYAQNGHSKEALELFFEAIGSSSPPLDLDTPVFLSALEACANVGDLDRGVLIHEKILESSVKVDALVSNSLINMYAKCGSVAKALETFEKLSSPGVIAWNTMITAYAQAGDSNAAIELFHQMDLEGIKPDGVTFMVLLEALGSIGSLQDGKFIHLRAASLGFDEQDTSLCNALLNLYTKCGSMQDAIALFHRMPTPNQISWTCTIAGYAQQGHSTEALELYQKMDLEGTKPNQVTLLGVLTACTHAGLVEDGIYYYNSMVSDHNIQPKEEHYGSLIDMLAKAGWLQEAEALIETLPFHPFAVAWTSLLGASCNHKDVDRAERVAAKAIDREPGNAGPYISLSNMYATLNRWDDVARVKKLIASLKGGGQ
ncbi:pentatricopeptide repeat-containing protein At3g12770 [Selaginella moellendorffii]|nr:pentatricopeptide repeat-containing protein At3g12770 [Selaginella moellendorffii]|eukprot:XP_024516750.1 pentatricopeptide repeat-containing protein At3g12770 [Selaginella moellendorffii]